MSDSLTKRLEQVQAMLREPLPQPSLGEPKMSTDENTTTQSSDEKPVKKAVSKKPVKKPVKKTVAATKLKKTVAPASDANVVTLAELAKTHKVSPQRARQKLRAAEVERDGRWSWQKGSKALAKVEKILAA